MECLLYHFSEHLHVIESLHVPGHSMAVSMLRDTIQSTPVLHSWPVILYFATFLLKRYRVPAVFFTFSSLILNTGVRRMVHLNTKQISYKCTERQSLVSGNYGFPFAPNLWQFKFRQTVAKDVQQHLFFVTNSQLNKYHTAGLDYVHVSYCSCYPNGALRHTRVASYVTLNIKYR
jgi:hypothetical protein